MNAAETRINTPPYTHKTYAFTLENGKRVFHNVISLYSVEQDGRLVQPTEAEQDEIDEIIEDAKFAEDCEHEKRATYELAVTLPELPPFPRIVRTDPSIAAMHRLMEEHFGMGDQR